VVTWTAGGSAAAPVPWSWPHPATWTWPPSWLASPGSGKTVAISRLAYLAARERRHLVVVDAKGEHDGLAGDVVAAVLQAWPQARIGLFPQAPSTSGAARRRRW
jgi:hypothetical protein